MKVRPDFLKVKPSSMLLFVVPCAAPEPQNNYVALFNDATDRLSPRNGGPVHEALERHRYVLTFASADDLQAPRLKSDNAALFND